VALILVSDHNLLENFGSIAKIMNFLRHTAVPVLFAFAVVIMFSCDRAKSQSVAQSRTIAPVLESSWRAYVQRFIQDDGRVIDYSASDISTSEGQAYAMLRAVWVGDRVNFDRTYQWALKNLNSGIRDDHLWAWRWGKDPHGKWGVTDKAFASDADQDAALALILAARVWNDEQYTQQARAMLQDLWAHGTVEVAGRRYLLAGDSLCKGTVCRINPSYYAPYAYRLFARLDGGSNWAALVDTSYDLLGIVSGFADTGLPPDWAQLNTRDGRITRSSEKDSAFSYDAFRVYWRIELDRELFNEPRADEYLRKSLQWISVEWKKRQKLPAVIAPSGKPLVQYESLEMISALMCAMHDDAMQKKLAASYSQGIWGDRDKYYLQNWAWFGTAVYNGFLGPIQMMKK
jgi:endoglucanase